MCCTSPINIKHNLNISKTSKHGTELNDNLKTKISSLLDQAAHIFNLCFH